MDCDSSLIYQEGVVMASMDHENVVRLYSVCMSKQLMLVSQFVPMGALIDYLKKNKDKLTASMMLQFATQISKVSLTNLSIQYKNLVESLFLFITIYYAHFLSIAFSLFCGR